MKFRLVKVKIDTEISIVTLGSICLLIATFIKASDVTSLFTLSGFCLVLSGAMLIQNKSVNEVNLLPAVEKKEQGEKLGFDDYSKRGKFVRVNVVANTLFDIGISILILGTILVLYDELINSVFIKMIPLYVVVPLIFLMLVWNYFNRRYF